MVSKEREELLKKLVNNVYDEVEVGKNLILGVRAENIESLIEQLVNEFDIRLAPTMNDYTQEQFRKIAEVAKLLYTNPIQENITAELDFEYNKSEDKTYILLGFEALFSKRTLEFYGDAMVPGVTYEEDYLYTHPICRYHEPITELLEGIEDLGFNNAAEDSGVTALLNYAFGIKDIKIRDVYSVPCNEFEDYDEELDDDVVIVEVELPTSVYKKYWNRRD